MNNESLSSPFEVDSFISLPESLLQIFNDLFKCLKRTPMKSINDLVNETIIQRILSEIGLSFEYEINNSSSFGLHYANHLLAFKHIDNYIKENCEKNKLTSKANILDTININDLLKYNEEMIIVVAQVIIFLSSICNNKDEYIDIVSEFNTDLIRVYFRSIEVFMFFDNDDPLKKTSTTIIEKSMTGNRSKYFKNINDNMMVDMDNTITQLKNKIELLEKENSDWEIKYNGKCREIDIIQKNNEQALSTQEQMLHITLKNADLLSEINQKNIIIEELKAAKEFKENKYMTERKSIQYEKEILEDKLQDYESLRNQYDRLSMKYKEMTQCKEEADIQALGLTIEQKTKQIDQLIKEKDIVIKKIDQMTNENCQLIQSISTLKGLCTQYKEKNQSLKECNESSSINVNKTPLYVSNLHNITIEGNGLIKEPMVYSQLKEAENQIEKLIEQKESLNTELLQTKTNYNIVTIKLSDIEKDLLNHKDIIETKEQEYQSCLQQKNEIHKELTMLKEYNDNIIAQLNSKISELECRKNKSAYQLSSVLENEFSYITSRSIEDDNSLSNSNESILEEQLKEKTTMITNLLQTITLLKSSSSNVSIELKNKIEALTLENVNFKETIAKCEKDIEEKNNQLNILQIKTVPSIIQNNNYDEEQYLIKINQYKEDIRLLNEEINQLKNEMNKQDYSLENPSKMFPEISLSTITRHQKHEEQMPSIPLESNKIITESLFSYAYKLLNG